MGRPRKRRREEDTPNENTEAGGNAILHRDSSVGIELHHAFEHTAGVPEVHEYGLNGYYPDHRIETTISVPSSSNWGSDSLQIATFNADILQEASFPSMFEPNPFSYTQNIDNEIQISTSNVTQPQVTPLEPRITTSIDPSEEPTCSCLQSLYASLSSFSSSPPPSFPYSMSGLKKATALARTAVRCQICTKDYNNALQNASLLNTLLQLTVGEYARLLKHIDERATMEAKIVFRMGADHPHEPIDWSKHTGTPDCPMGFNITLKREEWRMLARTAVRKEVLGDEDEDQSVRSILAELYDRQVGWHEHNPVGDNHPMVDVYAKMRKDDQESACAPSIFIDNLRKMLDRLGL